LPVRRFQQHLVVSGKIVELAENRPCARIHHGAPDEFENAAANAIMPSTIA